MRARLPDREGVIQRGGVRVAFEIFGHGNRHCCVRHRLDRYGAGTCMDYLATDPDLIAARIAELAGKPVSYRDVETDGAARAARLIAEFV